MYLIILIYLVCINNCFACDTETYCRSCQSGFNLMIGAPDDGSCMVDCPASKLYYDDLTGNCQCNYYIIT